MKIETHLYQLKFKENYGTVGPGAVRKGALLRVNFDDGLIGYCDCHPWEELGDWPLSQQLSALTTQKYSSLLNCSLRFARLDAEARKAQRSLFEGLEIPSSHRLIALSDNLEAPILQGINFFKLKVGSAPEKELAAMTLWVEKYPQIKLRLDFNEKLSRHEFLKFWDKMPSSIRNSIDYIEDPYPYDPIRWSDDQKQLCILLAADHAAKQALNYPSSAQFIVHKPAVEMPPLHLDKKTKLVITSYLDHPVGQMYAAYSAAILKLQHPLQVGYCGLLTHLCYQQNPFIDVVESTGSNLTAPKGTGIGFDSLLEKIKWQSL
jgi:O-succinylbenzoate synthase